MKQTDLDEDLKMALKGLPTEEEILALIPTNEEVKELIEELDDFLSDSGVMDYLDQLESQ